jgi:hypothetical protein
MRDPATQDEPGGWRDMRRLIPLVLATVLLGLVGSVVAGGRACAVADEPFPQYETVKEVPIVGHFPSKDSRRGPPPTRSWVRTTVHNLRVVGASRVLCHGILGELVACRVHIDDSVAARILVTLAGRDQEFIGSCQTLSGSLTTGPCFDFMAWEFNLTEQGPPPLPEE